MNTNRRWRLLPHEVLFGLMLVTEIARLAFIAGPLDGWTLFYLALLGINIATIWLVRMADTPGVWRIGLLSYTVLMNAVYTTFKQVVPIIHPARMDVALQHIDSIFIGTNLSVRLQAFVNPALTEFFSACYILFFPYLVFSVITYFRSDVRIMKKFTIGLFSIYGIGFLGYSFVPGYGPFVALAPRFTIPLTGWYITRWNSALVTAGSNGVDIFPSLHCAVSSFFLFFDCRHKRWRFWLYLVPCVGLWCSTIYLRYHYFTDVVCGFALAALGLYLAGRYPREEAGRGV